MRREADDLCLDTSKTALPPLRDVNHMIPLRDKKKVYQFRLLKCPEAFREQWRAKNKCMSRDRTVVDSDGAQCYTATNDPQGFLNEQ